MKFKILVSLIYLSFIAYAQTNREELKYTDSNKGKIYIYWGGNRASYSNSNIHFKGNDYDFTLRDVSARDKPKGFHIDYINPGRMTIPQTNFRIGYFINNHYNISFGLDHMKYVMNNNRRVNYSGFYPDAGIYGENPTATELTTTEDFLTFEHTDGLNYLNIELNRVDDISKWFGIKNTDKFQINVTGGVGVGVLLPKTNTMLLGRNRYDEFHLSGYGLSSIVGLNLTFFKHFFIQGELKGGFIDMPSIRTTANSSDKASQNFWFFERILAVGYIFRL